MIFYSGKKEIARIGNNHDYLKRMITLEDTEIICGVASSKNDGRMDHFKFITARLE